MTAKAAAFVASECSTASVKCREDPTMVALAREALEASEHAVRWAQETVATNRARGTDLLHDLQTDLTVSRGLALGD